MNKKILLFLLATIVFMPALENTAEAQESAGNSLSINFGLSNFHMLDEHATPLIFRGTGIAPSSGFIHTHDRNTHFVAASFYFNKLTSSSDNFRTEVYGGHFRYCYLRTMANTTLLKNRLGISAGVSGTSVLFKSDYMFRIPTLWATSIESIYWSHSLDVALNLSYDAGERSRFTILLFIPVISNVSRPEYSSSGDYDYEKNDWVFKPFGKTMVIPENLTFNTSISYHRKVSEKVSLNAGYEFYFARCRKPDLVKLYMNNFRIGINYNFKLRHQDEN